MTPSQLVPYANHLWQSFVRRCCRSADVVPEKESGGRAVLGLVHGVGKVPFFSILVTVGGLLGRHTTAAVPASRLVSASDSSSFVEQVGEPFTTTVSQFATPAAQRSYTSANRGARTLPRPAS
jgi:hypothetical protein